MFRFEKIAAAALSASMIFASGMAVFANDDQGVTDPGTNDTGETNNKIDLPAMDKDIINDKGEGVDSFGKVKPGEDVHFRLKVNVPGDLYKDRTFNQESIDKPIKLDTTKPYKVTFHDKMADTFERKGGFTVKIGEKDLTEGTHYTVKTGSENTDECTFEIEMDLVALYNAGKITDEDVKNATLITVDYTATLKTDASTGKHTNRAWVDVNGEAVGEDPEVDVDLFGIQITKKEKGSTQTLEGAVFKLEKVLENNATEEIGTADATGSDGLAEFNGLTEGTYLLTEVVAPANHVRLTQPLTIVVNKADAAKSGSEFVIEKDVENTTAPSTGGTGTIMFTIGGGALLATAMVIQAAKKRNAE